MSATATKSGKRGAMFEKTAEKLKGGLEPPSTGADAVAKYLNTFSGGAAAAGQPLAASPWRGWPLREVQLRDIHDDGRNARDIPDKDEKQKVAEMAASIKANGLLQPIAVHPKDGKLVRVFGSRRCAAMKVAGGESIPAFVSPHELSDEEVDELRAIENHQRRELNAAERALEAKRMYDTLAPIHGEKKALELTGIKLGGMKPAEVKDRIFVVERLEPRTRQLLAGGWINMGHARALTKVKGQAQIDIAESAAADAGLNNQQGGRDGSDEIRIWSVQEVENAVDQEENSLESVQWSLEDSMRTGVKGCDRCADCEHNTANNRDLFGLAEKEIKQSCTFPDGYAAKVQLTMKGLEKTTTTSREMIKKGQVEKPDAANAEAVRNVIELTGQHFLKPEVVQRHLKKVLGLQNKPTNKPAASAKPAAKADPKAAAEAKLEKAIDTWREKAGDAIHEAIGKHWHKKLAWILLCAAQVKPDWPTVYNREKPVTPTQAKLLAHAAEAAKNENTAAAIQALVEAAPPIVDINPDDGISVLSQHGPELLTRLAAVFDVTLPPVPVLADFLPKAAPAAAATGAGGAGGDHPADRAKAGTCWKCGCTEKNACEGGCSWANKEKTLCSRCINTTSTHSNKPIAAAVLGLTVEQLTGSNSCDITRQGKLRRVLWVYRECPYACIGSVHVGQTECDWHLVRLVPLDRWKGIPTRRPSKQIPEIDEDGSYAGAIVKCDGIEYVMTDDELKVIAKK